MRSCKKDCGRTKTFLDFDNGLNTAVNKLREVLNDSAASPRYVETVPRRGYRFLAPVQRWKPQEHEDPEGSEGNRAPLEQVRRTLRVLWATSIGLSILLILVLLGVIPPWLHVAPREQAAVRKLALAVNEPVSAAVISPNGLHIAYVTTSGVLKVQDLDQTEPREIGGPGVERAFTAAPFWSPDSEFLVFRLGDALRKVAAAGGPITTVCDLPGLLYLGGGWSPDGDSIVLGAGHSIYEVSALGGEPKILVEPWDPARPFLGGPEFLPSKGSRLLLYCAFSSGPNDALMIVQDLTTGHREALGEGFASAYSPPGYILYRRFDPPGILALPFSLESGRATGKPSLLATGDPPLSVSTNGTLVYVEKTAGLQQLVWHNRKGIPLGTIGKPREDFRSLTLSPDDRRVAFTEWLHAGNPDVWVYDLDRPSPTRITDDDGRDLFPVWSPDSKRLAFTSSLSGGRNLYVKQADGSGDPTPLLLTQKVREYATDWSPDGKMLLFHRRSSEKMGTDLWYLKLADDGNHEEVPVLRTPANERMPQLSLGGRLLSYVSDKSGQDEVYVCSFPNCESPQKVSVDGGTRPRWRADGRELFYVQQQSMMAAVISVSPTLTTGYPTKLFESETLASRIEDPAYDVFTYDVTRDGQRFVLVEQIEERSNTIRVVEDWFAEIESQKQTEGPIRLGLLRDHATSGPR